jgi:hypothetical protein
VRIEIHHFFHSDPAVLAEISNLRRDISEMNTKLSAAVAALLAGAAVNQDKLQHIEDALHGFKDEVAKAVADALAANDVDEDAAANTIDDVTNTLNAKIDEVLSAAPASGTSDPTVTSGAGDDTVSASGDPTVTSGAGDDTVSGAADAPAADTGSDAVVNEG